MKMKSVVTRFISSTLIISILSMSIWIPTAQATLIGSEQIVSSQAALQARERVLAFFERKDVQDQLQARGVSPEAAKSRVNTLTDNEIASINGHIDSLPAGGSDILGVALLVFLILLITDILGFTKVFPFTKAIQR